MNLLGKVTHNVELRSGILSPGALELILSIFRDFLSLKHPFLLEKIVGQRGSRGLMRFSDNRLKIVCRYILADAAVKEAISWGNPSCNALCSAQIAQLNLGSKPEFTWCMPLARFEAPSIPIADLLAFLRGPQSGPFIMRGFSGIGHARNWISKHESLGPQNGYSIRGSARLSR